MKLKFNLLATGLILIFSGCTGEETISNQKNVDSINIAKPVIETVNTTDFDQTELIEEEYDETELNFIISVAEGYNYDSLKLIALKTADILKFQYDSLGRYFNPVKKSIALPEDSDDEVYAGEYFPRRIGDEFVSVEMSSAYIDTSIVNNDTELNKITSDTTKMFVFATMYTDKRSADSLAGLIRENFPATTVFPIKIFIGCMH